MKNILVLSLLLLAFGANAQVKNIHDISDNQDATEVDYNNTTSGLIATDVQGALDELSVKECVDTVTVTAHGIVTAALESVYLDIVTGDAIYGLGVTGDTIPSLGSVIDVIDANTLVVQRCGFSDDVFGLAPGYYYNGLTTPSTTVGSCAVPAFIVSNDAIYFNHNNAYCEGDVISDADNGLILQTDGDVSLGYPLTTPSDGSKLDYDTGLDLNTNDFVLVGNEGESSPVVKFMPDNSIRFNSEDRTSLKTFMEWNPTTTTLFGGQGTTGALIGSFLGSYNIYWGYRSYVNNGNFNHVMGTRATGADGSDYNVVNINIGDFDGDYNSITGASMRSLGSHNILAGQSLNSFLTTINTVANSYNVYNSRLSSLNGSTHNIATAFRGRLDNIDFSLGAFDYWSYSDTSDDAIGTYTNINKSFINTTTTFADGVSDVDYSIIMGHRMKINNTDNSIVFGEMINNDADNVAIFMPFESNVSGNVSTHDFKFTNTTPDKFFAAYENGYDLYTSVSLDVNGLASFPTGVTVAAGGTAWASISARKFKEGGDVVDYSNLYDKFKDVEIFEGWNYIGQKDKHIGVMADDFYKLVADDIGNQHEDEKIETIDADGVQMALLKAMQEEIENLKKEINELKNK